MGVPPEENAAREECRQRGVRKQPSEYSDFDGWRIGAVGVEETLFSGEVIIKIQYLTYVLDLDYFSMYK